MNFSEAMKMAIGTNFTEKTTGEHYWINEDGKMADHGEDDITFEYDSNEISNFEFLIVSRGNKMNNITEAEEIQEFAYNIATQTIHKFEYVKSYLLEVVKLGGSLQEAETQISIGQEDIYLKSLKPMNSGNSDLPKSEFKSDRKINILGQEYTVEFRTPEQNPKLELMGADGLAELHDNRIVIDSKMNPKTGKEYDNFEQYEKKVVRHEIMHAFFHEAGLRDYCNDEILVEWLALQIPKICKVMQAHDLI